MSEPFSQIKTSRLYPVLLLEDFISRRGRRWFRRLGLLAAFSIALTLIIYRQQGVWWFDNLLGLLILAAAFLLAAALLDGYFRSYYFGSIITNEYRRDDLFTFTVGRIVYLAKDGDWLAAFGRSAVGQRVMLRLGVTPTEWKEFLRRRPPPPLTFLPLEAPEAGEVLKLRRFAGWLFVREKPFTDFLFQRGVKEGEFLATVDWVVREIESDARRERWWSRDNLQRISPLASDWAYGGTYVLDKYGRDFLSAGEAASDRFDPSFRAAEVGKLESVLSRSREANALLLGPAGEGKMEVLWQLARAMAADRLAPVFDDKRLVLLQSSLVLADCQTAADFERLVIKIFNEAVRAGNIILVIDDLPSFLLGAERLGANLSALLDPYLASAVLPVIALADSDRFHRYLGPRQQLARRFELVQVGDPDSFRAAGLLEETAERLERRHGVFFTYPALLEILKSAERYFHGESVVDKAMDILVEIAPWQVSSVRGGIGGRAERVINREAVWEFVKMKTNIPLGEVTGEEKEKLLGLEEILARRIIGQRSAINALANAIRRARTGLRSEKRPIGAFLFLGPTGVGKTETSKALAETFFGREELLLRLDMSEYQAADSLERLLGSFAADKPGVLTGLIRENPYGVLLLDEFEKTNKDVLNLFLQIFDEGFFSDMAGRRVNARNLMFIATSNAGADFIWQLVGEGKDLSLYRDQLIDLLVKRDIFRPELLNRFDEVIIFHPLDAEELRLVAALLCRRLADRLERQGLTLEVDERLASEVARRGADRLFGARPMNRFIQDQIEELIAKKLISGDLRSGDRFRVVWRSEAPVLEKLDSAAGV